MAEAKNTFLKAKMNKDLDDRLLPNGEYRDAQNILVGKSEEDSVGTLENIKGNRVIQSTNLDAEFAGNPYGTPVIIGYYMDSTNQRIYTFLTNWEGTNSAPDNEYVHCSIRYLDVNSGVYYTLVSGYFLNFSTQNNILGVNLLENLLFWTDNRNQPRKINVQTAAANPNHYYAENHISVAKYNPYESISLVKEEIEEITNTPASPGTTFEIAENTNITVGMTVLGPSITALDYVTVTDVNTVSPTTTITISDSVALAQGDKMFFLASTMTDNSAISTWPGDPDYLEDKFIRFAYRFKFEDNEYSIFSPFTQIAFIPKQKGYFLNGQEKTALSSTIVDWFENGINNIELIIPLPDIANNVVNSYKIKEIDVLYKESDQLAVKIVDTIRVSQLTSNEDTFYIYSYQSRKPIKTLPQEQTARVYDKVPVKAFAQEISGNRVMYGNFQTKHTPPSSIEYSISIQEKLAVNNYNNFIEYPNHTIKQNRNYQVGIVLSDKYGRQSDVILSPVSDVIKDIAGESFLGSTIYAEYIQDDPEGSKIVDPSYMPNGVIDWFGNSLVLAVNSPITSTVGSPAGSPGLYAQEARRFDIEQGTTPIITNNTYTFEITTVAGGNTGIPNKGDYMRGQYIDYVKVTENVSGSGTAVDPYVVTTDGQVNDLYLNDPASDPDIKFAYSVNPLGWYSYKVVVKQTEQEYYNVYLPSAIASTGFVTDSTDTDATVSYIALINDNINKIPRDLAEVGPDQKQYRSSVNLFGRVRPNGTIGSYGNEQFYPLRSSDVSTAIGNTNDLGGTTLTTTDAVFQYDSLPLLARVSTENQFGINHANFNTGGNDRFQLAVYETDPVVSNLDIYWETASVGLISDLNWDVEVGYDGPVAFEEPTFNFSEADPANTILTQEFYPLNNLGANMTGTIFDSWTVTNGDGVDVTADFAIYQVTSGTNVGAYYIENAVPITYVYGSNITEVYTFEITIRQAGTEWETATLSFQGNLTNESPDYDLPTPPYYYFDGTFVAGQEIHAFSSAVPFNNARNGAVSNTSSGLKWEIVSGNEAGYFSWDNNPLATYSTSGSLTLTAAGVNAPTNSYPLQIKLTDATSSGEEDPYSDSVIKNVVIIKGYPPLNISPTDTSYSSYYNEPFNADPFPNKGQALFYISDNTLVEADFGFTGLNLGNNNIVNSEFASPIKLGNKLELGTFVFGIEQTYITNIDAPATQTLSAELRVRAYYRETNSDPWVEKADLNNVVPNQTTPSTNHSINPINNASGTYAYNWYTWYANSADNAPGEYAFVVNIEVDPLTTEWAELVFNATIRDLHYNKHPQTQRVYEFKIDENNYAATPSGATYDIAGIHRTFYSDNPLAQYTEKFFEDSSLVNIYTPPVADQFYCVKLISNDDPIFPNVTMRTSTTGTSNTEIVASLKLKSNGDVDTSVPSPVVAYKQPFTTSTTQLKNVISLGSNNVYFP